MHGLMPQGIHEAPSVNGIVAQMRACVRVCVCVCVRTCTCTCTRSLAPRGGDNGAVMAPQSLLNISRSGTLPGASLLFTEHSASLCLYGLCVTGQPALFSFSAGPRTWQTVYTPWCQLKTLEHSLVLHRSPSKGAL